MIHDVKRKDVVLFLEPRSPAKVPKAAIWGDLKPSTNLYRGAERSFLAFGHNKALETSIGNFMMVGG